MDYNVKQMDALHMMCQRYRLYQEVMLYNNGTKGYSISRYQSLHRYNVVLLHQLRSALHIVLYVDGRQHAAAIPFHESK